MMGRGGEGDRSRRLRSIFLWYSRRAVRRHTRPSPPPPPSSSDSPDDSCVRVSELLLPPELPPLG